MVLVLQSCVGETGATHPPRSCSPGKGMTLFDRLTSMRATVSGRMVFTTSFGIEDQAIAHAIFTRKLEIEIVTLDTGRLFPASYKLWSETEEHYGATIRSVHPDSDKLSAYLKAYGVNGFYGSRDIRLGCCAVRKTEPLERALAGAAAWITGLRADQSGSRASVELSAWDEQRSLSKFAPLFDWTRDDVVQFCERFGVPVNPLHAQGFVSVGCEPCTRALRPGEPERAGRWWWEKDAPRECGLHLAEDGRLVRQGPTE